VGAEAPQPDQAALSIAAVAAFQEVLRNPGISTIDIVRGRLCAGAPFVFQRNPDLYQALRTAIANHFHVHPMDVLMVGSGHLGFSLAPAKLWAPLNADSDLDMVIISETVFVDFWEELSSYDQSRALRTAQEAEEYRLFKRHFFWGRIRPDYLPLKYRRTWFDFFSGISYKHFDGRKITGTIFYNRHFFEQYHLRRLSELR
jgi:hypothetical protein